MIKLIATDIDGTLLDDQKKFDRKHFSDLNKTFEEKNIKFVVASGNQYQQILHYFSNDYADKTYIAENGALIMSNGEAIFEKHLLKDQITNILNLLSEIRLLNNAVIVLSGKNGAYISSDMSDIFLDETQKYYRNVIKVDSLCDVKDDIYKIALTWIGQDARLQESILNAELDDVHVTSGGFGGLDIVPKEVNKGKAVEFLQDFWNIGRDETAAFGDSDNDIELLHSCDFGFAMKNANGLVLNSTKYVTEFDNNEDGVLRTIDVLV